MKDNGNWLINNIYMESDIFEHWTLRISYIIGIVLFRWYTFLKFIKSKY